MTNKKCTSKLGPENCGREDCPERGLYRMNVEVPKSFTAQASARPQPKVPFGAWTSKDTELLKTIHGSKLYGLDHAESDDDFYIITPTVRVARRERHARMINAKQTIRGKDDTTVMDFASFIKLCGDGVPQSLEAMYSREAESEYFEDYRRGYFCSDPAVIHTYMRTIKAFSMTEKQPFKRRRHSLRLALNLESILYTGRFDPKLKPAEISKITRFAEKGSTDYFKELKAVSPIEVDWDNDFNEKHG